MSYQVGIDLGTTFTAAAVFRDDRASIFSLGGRSAAIPSVVLLREDETILTGEAAVRRAMTEPERVAREFKRRLGDTTPIIVGGTPYSAEALMSRLLRHVLDEVAAREGGPPDRIAVSHPANWGEYKHDLLRQAIQLAGIDSSIVTLLSEPEAAAISYASQERVDPGETVAVYDLGGGTFDAAVLRRTDEGFELIGKPEGIERLGGIDFDAAVFAHVTRSLDGAIEALDHDDPATISAVARLRQDCVDAKEALSSDTDATIPVLLPGLQTEVRITRGEFESLIRPSLVDSIEALRRALRSAGVDPSEVARVLLVGGSSRVPLIAQMVSSELGRPIAVDAHPKHAIALGAAYAAAGAISGGQTPLPAEIPAEPAQQPEEVDAVAPAEEQPSLSSLPPPAAPEQRAPMAAGPAEAAPPVNPGPETAPPAETAPAAPLTAPPSNPDPAAMPPSVAPATPAPAVSEAAPTQSEAPLAAPAAQPDTSYRSEQATPVAASGTAAVGPQETSSGGGRGPLIGVIAVVALLVIGGAGWAVSQRGGGTDDAGSTTTLDEVDDETSTTSQSTTTTEAPVVRSDQEIGADLAGVVADFDTSPISVNFEDGVATVAGFAFDDAAKTSILDSVGAVDGVESVDSLGLAVMAPSQQCGDRVTSQPRWICLTNVEFDGSELVAEFESEDGGAEFSIGSGFHVHFFDGDLTEPVQAGVNGDASTGGGDWQVWDLTPLYTSAKWDGTDIALLCGRIATSRHTLESLDSGNCWPVTRTDTQ